MEIRKNEIQNIFTPLCGIPTRVIPIGHHELKRHFVYRVYVEKKVFVIKLYYKEGKWDKECAFYEEFHQTPLRIPKLLKKGETSEGIQWIILEYIQGETMEKAGENISEEDREEIYYEFGREIGFIHSYPKKRLVETIFPDLLNGESSYREFFLKRLDKTMKELYEFEHEEIELIKKAEKKIREEGYILDDIGEDTQICLNDSGPRNFLVAQEESKYSFQSLIDFEQFSIGDRYKELVYLYLPIKDTTYGMAFKRGYCEFLDINLKRLHRVSELYNLFSGIYTCSWAKEDAYDFYLKAVESIKKIIDC